MPLDPKKLCWIGAAGSVTKITLSGGKGHPMAFTWTQP